MKKTVLAIALAATIFSQSNAKVTRKTTKEKTMYDVKHNLKPSGLAGISDNQVNDHWKLYEGYVKQVNNLHKELTSTEPGSLAYADRRRRYGFEYNGMVLHEYYFENLVANGTPLNDGSLKKAIEQTWGSYDAWEKDFVQAGKTRGIGWAILYLDPTTKRLSNHFISEHQNGHIAGYTPIMVIDVWEHAYMVDHGAGGRGAYLAACMKNLNWTVAKKRFG